MFRCPEGIHVSVPHLDDVLGDIAGAGTAMTELGACEGAAGNISVWARDLDAGASFPPRGEIALPCVVPALAGGWIVATVSGGRLRDVARRPDRSICLLHVLEAGQRALLYAAGGQMPTSELNSHLAIHDALAGRDASDIHAVVHAQPLRLTFLSHLERYADEAELNRRLLRWQQELIVVFGKGIALLPYLPTASPQLMAATARALLDRRAAVWRKHGVVTHASSAAQAGDLVEYLETAARYEVLNMLAGEPNAGLSAAEIRDLAATLGIDQTVF